MNLIASRRNEPKVNVEIDSDSHTASHIPHLRKPSSEEHELHRTLQFALGSHDTFDAFDVDKDGYIDAKEARQLASSLGLTPGMDVNRFKKGAMAIDSVDTDRDHKISVAEWNA